MRRWVVAGLALAAAVVFVEDAGDHGEPWIGLAVWVIFAAFALPVSALATTVASLARRRRPARGVWLGALLATIVLIFPLGASWDTVEGPDSEHGLVMAPDRVALAVGLTQHPQLPHSATCCG